MIDNDLVLDRLKAGSFAVTLGGTSYILNVPADDAYPSNTTILNASSSAIVGKAFLDDGIFCFIPNISGVTNSSLANLFAASGGFCTALNGNSVEYQNSYIYFCRAQNKEYTYSLNSTYGVSASEYIGAYRVRNDFIDDPKAYITGVGLYDNAGDLLAVAKTNVPRKKDLFSEALFKIKLTL